MKTQRLNDNSSVSKESLSDISNLVNKVADKTLEQLEREGIFVFPNVLTDADGLSSEQMILQSYNDTYRTGNVMGFMGLGNERLAVTSRFNTGKNDYLFQYLLERVLDFPNVIKLDSNTNDDEQIYDLMLFLFPKYLTAALRKGVLKSYIRRDYNDPNIKGKININSHIKNNTPFIGNIAYCQREHSYDNYLIELIRHTIDVIRRKPYGHKLLFPVKEEVKLIEDAAKEYTMTDRRQVLEKNKKNPVRHAYFSEYRALQKLCILILDNQKQSFGTGTHRVYGILFDGAWLWEEYLYTVIGDMFYHPMNTTGRGKELLFVGNGEIYPDFIGKHASARIIADAKYKPINNIGRNDYQQLLAYMYRFDSKQGFYLYPDSCETGDKQMPLYAGLKCENNRTARDDIAVTKCSFPIPMEDASYSEFSLHMKESEVEFRSKLEAVS